MATKQRQTPVNPHRAVVALIESFRPNHRILTVWGDFIAAAACALSSRCDPARREAREREYEHIQRRYTESEMSRFSECLAYTAIALSTQHQDFLGHLYMSLDLGNRRQGQFFTPYAVSRLNALLTLGKDVAQQVERAGGFVTMMDPCIGSGAMPIAVAEVVEESGLRCHDALHVVGVDVDITAVQMAYIQLSILNVPAVILHGNSLSLDPYKAWNTDGAWRTPAHCRGGWERRLHDDRRPRGSNVDVAMEVPARPASAALIPEETQPQPCSEVTS